MKSLLITIAMLVATATQAMTIECKMVDVKNRHQIQITLIDYIIEVSEQWNGDFKTSDEYRGLIQPVNGSYETITAYWNDDFRREHTKAKLSYAPDNTAVLEFEGFLEPTPNGVVQLVCKKTSCPSCG